MFRHDRILAVLIITCITVGGCNTTSSFKNNGVIVTTSLKDKPVLVGSIPCEFPLTKEDTSLNVMISNHKNVPAENIYVWQQYEKMTGVKVNWTVLEKDKRQEIIYNTLTNHGATDLIIHCRVDTNQLMQYGTGGYIYDLAKDDLLKKNAPNCWTFLQSHPDALASVMSPDGAIYSLPQVNSGAELRVSRKVFINKNWLKRVNMDVPTTTEEFYHVLKAFQEQDANNNGDPSDEIPFCSQDWISVEDVFSGSFGLINRGIHNNLVDADPDSGKVRLIAASDPYRLYLAYMNKLYSEKLLDNNIFQVTMEQWLNYAENDRIGVFANTNLATLPANKTDNWIAIEEPLTGPQGDKLCSSIRANFHSCGAAVIPTSCKNPELVLRWLDYFWTDEGTLFYHMGIENETFTANPDGTYAYAPSVLEQIGKDNKSFDDVISLYSPYPGGSNPTVEIAPYFMGGEMADIPASAARKLFEYGTDEFWPSFTFTPEETEQLDIVQTDMKKYIDSMRIEFITGTKSLDNWEDYNDQLDRLGKKELLDIYQAAVDRFHVLIESQPDQEARTAP